MPCSTRNVTLALDAAARLSRMPPSGPVMMFKELFALADDKVNHTTLPDDVWLNHQAHPRRYS
jgi:hypothetical protein